jgi:hypothetical protein
MPRTRGQEAREASAARESLLGTIAALVFAYLPLSVQAITALSKAWKQWAEEQRAKERALETAESFDQEASGFIAADSKIFYVPLWAAQQQQQLSDEQKRRFQLRAVAHGDVGAADWFGVPPEGACAKYSALVMCATAARDGRLEVLQWLRNRGCAWDANTCSEAAKGGHLAVLQWARANGCDWDGGTCAGAASYGRLAVLQWARANGCDWDADTCSEAAKGGHLAVLQWARANGCDWDADTCSKAARGGHLGVLQWARANGCPEDFEMDDDDDDE